MSSVSGSPVSAPEAPLLGVCLSATFDIAGFLAEAARRWAPGLDLRRPEAIDDPAAVRFAVAWEPAGDAFAPYPNLQLVSAIAAGVDNIFAASSLPATVPVMRIRDPEQARIMAGFIAWNVVWWERRFGEFLTNQKAHRWQRLPVHAPSTRRVGLLGFGLMGQTAAVTLRSLGHPVTAWARTTTHADAVPGVRLVTGRDGLEAMLAETDILIDLLPLTPETRGILSADLFARLPHGAVLIHVGRGPHLDEAALLAALDSGHLAGASVDVFAEEPIGPDHPFWSHPKIVVTPHDAAETTPKAIVESISAELRRLETGEALENVVTRERGY